MSEDLSLSMKQLERQTAKLQDKPAGSGSSRETELENELRLTMVLGHVSGLGIHLLTTDHQNVLKCTACKGAEFRNTVLTKCMHSELACIFSFFLPDHLRQHFADPAWMPD